MRNLDKVSSREERLAPLRPPPAAQAWVARVRRVAAIEALENAKLDDARGGTLTSKEWGFEDGLEAKSGAGYAA